MLTLIEEYMVKVMIGVEEKVALEKIGGGNGEMVSRVEMTGSGGVIVELVVMKMRLEEQW